MNRTWIAAAGLAVLLLSVGCGKGNFSKQAQAGNADVFRYPIVTNPTTLDPGIVQDGDTIDLLQQVYEGLVGWGEDNQVHPILCDKWDVEDGGKTYVFHIKHGVKFHNGRELQAEDFKWTMERNCAQSFNSPTATNYLSDIVGVTEMATGKATSISGITVVDPYTLKIQIDKPRAYFLGKLTYIVSAPLPKEAVGNKEINSVQGMVGTGPFKVVSYVPNQITVLEANKDYHGGPPKVSKIERPVIKDAATRLNKYKAGEIDLVMLERQDVKALQQDQKFKADLKFFDRPSIYYIGMNQKSYEPWRNRDIRRAIAMAIDKKHIVDDILEGMNVVANSIVPPGVIGHRESAASIPYDPAGAKKLLAQAGFPDPSKLPPVELYFREQRPDIQLVGEQVSLDLKKNLGITVKTHTMEWRSYLQKWDAGEIPFFHMRWAADYLDPENFLSHMLATTGPENRGVNYHNEQFDALCAEADATMDTNKRLELYAKAEDIALQDAPWIPVYFQRDAELISPRVKGIRESLFGHLPHTTLSLDK